jgi:hypothetical protein
LCLTGESGEGDRQHEEEFPLSTLMSDF